MYGSQLSKYGLSSFGASETSASYGLTNYGLGLFGQGEQPAPPAFQFLPGWLIYGRLGRPTDLDPLGVMGIWQRRKTREGIRSVKMKFYEVNNPRTPAQQANREKFALAMQAWQSLTLEEKAVYNKRAKRLSLLGRNLFIREYYQLN